MPTFVLKKYNPAPEKTGQETAPQSADQVKESQAEPDQMLKIKASANISEIVIMALYKSLPNNVTVEEVPDKEGENVQADETNVITTEDINLDPVSALRAVTGKTSVAVIGSGFSTEKDDWFLTNIQSQGISPMYTMAGFVSHVKAKLGV